MWKVYRQTTDNRLSVRLSVNFSHFHLLLKNHWANFNQTGTNVEPRPFPRWDNYEIAKVHWRNLFFKKFLRTTWPISTKLGTKHPWVKGIQVCSNEGPHPFPRGDNYNTAKIHWQNLKIFFSRTTEPISTKLGTKHFWVKGTQSFTNKDHLTIKKS